MMRGICNRTSMSILRGSSVCIVGRLDSCTLSNRDMSANSSLEEPTETPLAEAASAEIFCSSTDF